MSIEKVLFDKLPSGEEVSKYIMTNANGMSAHILDYGLRVQSLFVMNKEGGLTDVVIGYDSIDGYLDADYQGCFVGRYANRIAEGKFSIDGETYTLEKNNGNNSLHGGPGGYHQVIFKVESINNSDEPSIVFTHTSPDGEEGYPGKLDMKITYTLTNQNEMNFEYEATTDKTTAFNPTNHSYFNLEGDHTKTVFKTELQINATTCTEINDELIPTGKILPVKGTGLDFTICKPIGQDIASDEETISSNNGFDHNFCVDSEGYRLHAKAFCPSTGISMEVNSDMPGVQLYTNNEGNKKTGKKGVIIKDHTAFCLETQFYPDSVNRPEFPFKFLKSGDKFYSKTSYKFSV